MSNIDIHRRLGRVAGWQVVHRCRFIFMGLVIVTGAQWIINDVIVNGQTTTQQICLLQSSQEILPGQTMPKKLMTPERLWQLRRLQSTALSPDGKRIAYTIGQFDLHQNTGSVSLHVVDITSGKDVSVLENWSSIGSLQWVASEENPRIFFVGKKQPTEHEDAETSDRSSTIKTQSGEQEPQVWWVRLGKKEAQRITSVSGGVGVLKLSPAGNRIAFSTRIKMRPEVNELYEDLPKADARIIDSLMYRHWDKWDDYKFSHIHIADVPVDGECGEMASDEVACDNVFDLMAGVEADCPVGPWGGGEQFDWSPDGAEIAFTMKHITDGTQWAQSTNTDVYVIDVPPKGTNRSASGVAKKPFNLTAQMQGYDRNPLYSPDGKWIVFSSMQRPGFEADRARVMIYDRKNKVTRELTQAMDQNAHHVVWASDSQSIYFESEVQGTQQIFQLPVTMSLEGRDITPAVAIAVTSGRFHWTMVGEICDSQSVIAKRSDMLRPDEIFRVDREENSVTAISKINDDVYRTLELPTVEAHWVEASDGKQIHAWVIRPIGFDAGQEKQWPMLLYCQGGPQAQVGQNFSWRWNFHLMAAQGYVVVAPNRRGLPGFGQQWNDQISGDWGGQAMRDLVSVTDHFSSQPTIDSKRVAAVGASFGGYSIYWMMGHHEDRFAAMIAHCGVFNLESMYGSTEELFFVDWDLGGPYWASEKLKQDYRDFSPHQFVKKWDTPLLVIHGQQDFRVPVTQGMEAFTAAQVKNVPSRFLYFPHESHWVTSPQNSVLWHRVFFDWLDRYCGETTSR